MTDLTPADRFRLDAVLTDAGLPLVSDAAWSAYDRNAYDEVLAGATMLKIARETPPSFGAEDGTAPAPAPAPAPRKRFRAVVPPTAPVPATPVKEVAMKRAVLQLGLWVTDDNRLFRVTRAKAGHPYATEWSPALSKFVFEQGVTSPDLLRHMKEGKVLQWRNVGGVPEDTLTTPALVTRIASHTGTFWDAALADNT